MKSPFPGMDPFIEGAGLWEDFHGHLIEKVAEDLAGRVPKRYVVRTGERAYVVLTDSQQQTEHAFKPDVGITSRKASQRRGGMALKEPPDAESIPMRALVSAEYRETFVEIHALEPERRLVTCIEVLSPSNKRPGTSGWELYQRKRQALLLGEANLIEIDLLRGGERPPMIDPWPAAPYTLLVCRRTTAPSCRVWKAHYRTSLPGIPLPLMPPDPDGRLNLQPLVDEIYAHYRYDEDLDYAQALKPPLGREDVTWLKKQLRMRKA